jgi:hypothetical protein
MTKTIRIDGVDPTDNTTDGRWIMRLAGGSFDPEFDHSLCSLRDGVRVGGFVTSAYLGASVTVHMAGTDPRWCSRDLLWMLFDFVFVRLGVHKALTTVVSDNHLALALDLRAGWQVEAIVRDVTPTGAFGRAVHDAGAMPLAQYRAEGV